MGELGRLQSLQEEDWVRLQVPKAWADWTLNQFLRNGQVTRRGAEDYMPVAESQNIREEHTYIQRLIDSYKSTCLGTYKSTMK